MEIAVVSSTWRRQSIQGLLSQRCCCIIPVSDLSVLGYEAFACVVFGWHANDKHFFEITVFELTWFYSPPGELEIQTVKTVSYISVEYSNNQNAAIFNLARASNDTRRTDCDASFLSRNSSSSSPPYNAFCSELRIPAFIIKWHQNRVARIGTSCVSIRITDSELLGYKTNGVQGTY